MHRKDYWLILILVICSSFIGGALTSWLLIGSIAFANPDDQPSTLIKARAFQLVDATGKIRANLSCFSINPASDSLKERYFRELMKRQDTTEIIRVIGSEKAVLYSDEVVFQLFDSNGNIIWSAPEKFKAKYIK